MRTPRLYSRADKSWQGSSRGFTLIEILVALALFSIIAIVFAGGLTTASRAVITAGVRTTAESLARTQMESVKNQDYKEATGPDWQVTYDRVSGIPDGYLICSLNWTTNETANCGYTVSPSVIGVAWDSTANQPATDETGLQKITLAIKHDDKDIITLEGYKRNPAMGG
jgi:prepilin-type N-terminal cleavage/methylation domain-containing protein